MWTRLLLSVMFTRLSNQIRLRKNKAKKKITRKRECITHKSFLVSNHIFDFIHLIFNSKSKRKKVRLDEVFNLWDGMMIIQPGK